MKKILYRIAALTLVFSLIAVPCLAAVDLELIKINEEKWHYVQFDRGSGTKNDPYIIDEIEDLEFMSDTVFRSKYSYPGRYFRLDRDLYLNDITKPVKEWKGYFPIGWDKIDFEGHFDGDGHTIYGYKALYTDYNDCKGLFGRVKNGSIKNLTMSDFYFTKGNAEDSKTGVFVRALTADSGSATIENCHVRNPRSAVTRLVTSVYATNGATVTIKDCTVNDAQEQMIDTITSEDTSVVRVSGLVRNPKKSVDENGDEGEVFCDAGIIATVYSTTSSKGEGTLLVEDCINNCPVYNYVTSIGVSSMDRGHYESLATGGILNVSFKKSGNVIVRNCTNNALVFGIGGVGGIAGFFTHGQIENCVNNGTVYGAEARVGGIVGQHTDGDIIGCVNYGDVRMTDGDIMVGLIRFGGIAGVNNGVIESCINYGNILGSEAGNSSMETGGIVGRGSYIYNCANHGGLVRITAVSGGIAGTVAINIPDAVVDCCYNIGGVSASPYNSGSVIGTSQSPTLNCYYLLGTHPYGRYTDQAEVGFAHADYKALTYQEIYNPESFAGFDFTKKWIVSADTRLPIPRKAHFGDVAIPMENEMDINGNRIKVYGYNINDNNYYKIRDIAYMLNGTKSNFSVEWNEEAGVIVIKTKTAYVPLGSENTLGDNYDRAVNLKNENVSLNGKNVALRAYEIDGSNYFTLREVAQVIGFKVDWDEKEQRILIEA